MKLLLDTHTFMWWDSQFDRLLIAQSRVESAHLVSRDAKIRVYDCQILW